MIIQQWVDRPLNQNPGWLGDKKGMKYYPVLQSFTGIIINIISQYKDPY